MERDPRAYLWEVQQAADAILKFTSGLDFAAYAESELVQSAVERKFEIIGEALNRLSRFEPVLAGSVSDARRAIDFRNQLIHGYHQTEHDKVWEAIEIDLPRLHLAVTALLSDMGSPDHPARP